MSCAHLVQKLGNYTRNFCSAVLPASSRSALKCRHVMRSSGAVMAVSTCAKTYHTLRPSGCSRLRAWQPHPSDLLHSHLLHFLEVLDKSNEEGEQIDSEAQVEQRVAPTQNTYVVTSHSSNQPRWSEAVVDQLVSATTATCWLEIIPTHQQRPHKPPGITISPVVLRHSTYMPLYVM